MLINRPQELAEAIAAVPDSSYLINLSKKDRAAATNAPVARLLAAVKMVRGLAAEARHQPAWPDWRAQLLGQSVASVESPDEAWPTDLTSAEPAAAKLAIAQHSQKIPTVPAASKPGAQAKIPIAAPAQQQAAAAANTKAVKAKELKQRTARLKEQASREAARHQAAQQAEFAAPATPNAMRLVPSSAHQPNPAKSAARSISMPKADDRVTAGTKSATAEPDAATNVAAPKRSPDKGVHERSIKRARAALNRMDQSTPPPAGACRQRPAPSNLYKTMATTGSSPVALPRRRFSSTRPNNLRNGSAAARSHTPNLSDCSGAMSEVAAASPDTFAAFWAPCRHRDSAYSSRQQVTGRPALQHDTRLYPDTGAAPPDPTNAGAHLLGVSSRSDMNGATYTEEHDCIHINRMIPLIDYNDSSCSGIANATESRYEIFDVTFDGDDPPPSARHRSKLVASVRRLPRALVSRVSRLCGSFILKFDRNDSW